MITPEIARKITGCQKKTKVSNVKVEEHGKKAVFSNNEKHSYIVTRFDQCVIIGSAAADYLVQKPNVGCVIVELKGGNVERGLTQVVATAQFLVDHRLEANRIAGLIVCTQIPRVNTIIQRAQQRFRDKFNSPLHVKSGNRVYVFEQIIGFI